MARQKERAATTRAMLLETFRSSLLSRGLEATTTQLVLDETGLSKGALYHHFRSKDEIIEALYTRESEAAIDRAFSQPVPDRPPLERLRDGCIAWLATTNDPAIATILFEIGPSALGQERARQIENRHGIARIRELLEEAEKDGTIVLDDAQLVAAFVNSLVAEATLHSMKTGKNVSASLAVAIDALLAGLARAPKKTASGKIMKR